MLEVRKRLRPDGFLKRPCWLLQDVMHWPLNTHSLILHTQTYTYTHTHTHKHVHTFACQSFADATGTIRRLNTQLPNLATPWYADMVAVRSTSSLTHTPGTNRRESRASSSAPQVNSFPTVRAHLLLVICCLSPDMCWQSHDKYVSFQAFRVS